MSQTQVYFVSLGCPKNQVDSEQMLWLVDQQGMSVAVDPQQADAIVVHTCGFIGDATEESINTVLEMAQYKSSGVCRALIVTGCLVQRFADELKDEIPEVDAFLGTSTYRQIAEVISQVLKTGASDQAKPTILVESLPGDGVARQTRRIIGEHSGSAYLKISEGCDRKCSFCIIPKLRGPQRSRPLDELVDEARGLVQQGVVELTLIAQELTGYGRDLEGQVDLVQLLRALAKLPELRWIRCMYAYPQGVTHTLLKAMADIPKVLPYLDIPVQHSSSAVLRRMHRGSGGRSLQQRLMRIQRLVPNMVLRTTLLTGFPGETETDFEELLEFIDKIEFDRLGVFAYSNEEGTESFSKHNQVAPEIAQQRMTAVMQRQQEISKRLLARQVGTVHEAIVEGLHPESELLVVGRLWSQAKEIDGLTYISSPRPLRAGEIVKVRVVESHDYDLVAEVLEPDDDTAAAPFERTQKWTEGL